MVRGTTPTNTFEVDADLTEASAVYITYDQGGKVVFEKSNLTGGVEITKDTVLVNLTQEDTLALNSSMPVKIQIRAKFPSGSAIASNMIRARVEDILKDGEI